MINSRSPRRNLDARSRARAFLDACKREGIDIVSSIFHASKNQATLGLKWACHRQDPVAVFAIAGCQWSDPQQEHGQ